MDIITKQILNNLKCPICKAPIDFIPRGVGRGYNYSCSYNFDHYKVLITNYPLIRHTELNKEAVCVHDAKHKYEIIKTHQYAGTPNILTEIIVYDIDPEGRVNFTFKEKRLVIDYDIFNFTNFNHDKAVNRIKMIFIFQ